MLDVQRGPDVDAGVQQVFHILPALGVAAAGHVGMGIFVHKQQLRPAGQRAFEVEFRDEAAAIMDRPARQDGKALEHGLGLAPAMGLHDAHHHVEAIALAARAAWSMA